MSSSLESQQAKFQLSLESPFQLWQMRKKELQMQPRNTSQRQHIFAAGTTSSEVLVTGGTITMSRTVPQANKRRLWNTTLDKLEQYYMKDIHPEVYASIGWWVLEKEGVYSHFSGVVTNQSESFNTILKSLQQWKEFLHRGVFLLQSFFMNEITWGLTSQGNYHLHHQFLPLMEEAEVAEPAFICVQTDEIVSHIRDGDMTSQSHSPWPQEKVVSEPQKPPSALTQLVQSGKIYFDSKLHLFNVLGSGDRPYVVRLSMGIVQLPI